jgi:hypothetical protein
VYVVFGCVLRTRTSLSLQTQGFLHCFFSSLASAPPPLPLARINVSCCFPKTAHGAVECIRCSVLPFRLPRPPVPVAFAHSPSHLKQQRPCCPLCCPPPLATVPLHPVRTPLFFCCSFCSSAHSSRLLFAYPFPFSVQLLSCCLLAPPLLLLAAPNTLVFPLM